MGREYTEAQKAATLKYQNKMAQIKITVTPEQRDKYRELADQRGTTITGLIVELLEMETKKER